MTIRPGLTTGIVGAVLAALAAAWSASARPSPRDPAWAVAGPGSGGARNLVLAPDLSFTDDSSANFPIRGDDLADGRIASDRPTAIFFGTSHCWNTAREAERFVALYREHSGQARFLVVDLRAPSPDQKALVARLYSGSIPTLAFLDHAGNVVYDRSGETAKDRADATRLEELLREAESGAR